MIRGAVAAALTPLRDGGAALDEAAFEPYVDFLAGGGVDGILALGTTGEGILLRRPSAGGQRSSSSRPPRAVLGVAVHCGAQTTAETVALAAHAAEAGADAVAVIAPPFFPLDEARARGAFRGGRRGLRAGRLLRLRVRACAAATRCPCAVIERLRERAPNLRGLKVSDRPWETVEPYLLDGLDIFVGAEALVARGLARRCRRSGLGPRSGLPGASWRPSFASPRRSTPTRPSGYAGSSSGSRFTQR